MPKTITPLTDAKCRAAKFNPEGGNKLFDGGGLYLEVVATGAKRWRFRFKQANGKESLVTLGEYPALTLTAARLQRGTMRQKMASGGPDPVTERLERLMVAKISAENTVKSVAKKWIATRKGGWGPKHLSKVEGAFERDVYPQVGQRPIADVRSGELLSLLQLIEKRGSLSMAHKTLEFLGELWKYAVGTEVALRDVTIGLRKLLKTKPPVKHHPNVGEKGLPALIDRIENYAGRPETIFAIKFMLLTWQRTNEMRWAQWSEFDFEAAEWPIPPERMKGTLERKANSMAHIVPLARQSIALLNDLRAYTGDYRYLFPGVRNPATQVMSAETINKALKSMGFEGKQTGHGFRGLASTILNERTTFNPDAIERQLSHVEENKIKGAYDRSKHLEARRAMMQWWADYIDQVSGKASAPTPAAA